MKVINTIAALTCVGYALHYTDILPASDYEILANRAIASAKGTIDRTLKQYGPAVAEAPKPCPPVECKPEVVRTVGSAPSPQAVVVTLPAQVAGGTAPVPAAPQTGWPSLSIFQSQPQVPAPSTAPAAAPAAPTAPVITISGVAPAPAAQPAQPAASQPSTMTFSAAQPVMTTVTQPRPAAAQEQLKTQSEAAAAKPVTKTAATETIEKSAAEKPEKAASEKPVRTHKVAVPVRDRSASRRPAASDRSRDWVASAMSRS